MEVDSKGNSSPWITLRAIVAERVRWNITLVERGMPAATGPDGVMSRMRP